MSTLRRTGALTKKRSLALVVVALVAVPSFSALAGAQTASTARGTPTQVTANTTPKRDRTRPYVFTTTGRIGVPRSCNFGEKPGSGTDNCRPLICPPGALNASYCQVVPPSQACAGRVNVRFQKRTTTISARNVTVRPDCTFRSRVRFSTRVRTRLGTLRVRARFQGNKSLGAKFSATRTVRAG